MTDVRFRVFRTANRISDIGHRISVGSLHDLVVDLLAERDPLLMGDAKEAFGAPVAPQRIEHDAQRAVKPQIDPEGRAACRLSRLHAPESMAA